MKIINDVSYSIRVKQRLESNDQLSRNYKYKTIYIAESKSINHKRIYY